MLIDLRNLLSGAKDDMTVSAPLEMETFRTALAEYPVMEKQPVNLCLQEQAKTSFIFPETDLRLWKFLVTVAQNR